MSEHSQNDGASIKPETKSSEIKQKPHFKFVLGGHETKEDAEQIVRAVKDCAVLAIEWVGGTKEERRSDQAFWQKMANQSKDDPETIEILGRMKEDLDAGVPHMEYMYYFTDGITGSGKKILVIDMDEDDPSFGLTEENDDLEREYHRALDQRLDLPTVISKLRASIEIAAKFYSMREDVVIKQLENIGTTFENEDNLTIGIMEGGAHTRPSHHMHRAGYPVERIFPETPEAGRKGFTNRMYDWHHDAIRRKMFFPQEPLTDNFLKHVIGADIIRRFGNKSQEQLKKIDLDLERTSQEELDMMLSRIFPTPPPRS